MTNKVLLGLSGGDWLIYLLIVLLQKAIGDQLTCIFVDLVFSVKWRWQIMEMLGGKFGLNIIRVDASKRFLRPLGWCWWSRKKRKIIVWVCLHVFVDDKQANLKVWTSQLKELSCRIVESDCWDRLKQSDLCHSCLSIFDCYSFFLYKWIHCFHIHCFDYHRWWKLVFDCSPKPIYITIYRLHFI